MFSLCGVLGGVFLAMDFQLNNRYLCHGITRYRPEDDGGNWTPQAHTLWTIVYAVAIFFFTLPWLLLEKEMFSKKVKILLIKKINIIIVNDLLFSFQNMIKSFKI